jgi:hypothetical protein
MERSAGDLIAGLGSAEMGGSSQGNVPSGLHPKIGYRVRDIYGAIRSISFFAVCALDSCPQFVKLHTVRNHACGLSVSRKEHGLFLAIRPTRRILSPFFLALSPQRRGWDMKLFLLFAIIIGSYLVGRYAATIREHGPRARGAVWALVGLAIVLGGGLFIVAAGASVCGRLSVANSFSTLFLLV